MKGLKLELYLFIQRFCRELDGLLGHPLRLVHRSLVLCVQVVDYVTWTPENMDNLAGFQCYLIWEVSPKS